VLYEAQFKTKIKLNGNSSSSDDTQQKLARADRDTAGDRKRTTEQEQCKQTHIKAISPFSTTSIFNFPGSDLSRSTVLLANFIS
jgi:hypothetical protein